MVFVVGFIYYCSCSLKKGSTRSIFTVFMQKKMVVHLLSIILHWFWCTAWNVRVCFHNNCLLWHFAKFGKLINIFMYKCKHIWFCSVSALMFIPLSYVWIFLYGGSKCGKSHFQGSGFWNFLSSPDPLPQVRNFTVSDPCSYM